MSEELPLREAVALGLVQGPAELLPISSSSHTALIPWLLGWRCAALDVQLRRSFEVALHGGTAAALVVDGRGRAAAWNAPALSLLLAIAPPAAVGYLLEGFIDRRLSGPPAIAIGLLAGAAGMAAAERRRPRARHADEAGAVDGLLLGGAQVFALAPGISRNGATLAVARARGFSRADADMLSWQVGVPVIVGAGALKAYRAARRGYSAGLAPQLAAGALAAFCSTLLSARLLERGRARAGCLQRRGEAKASSSRGSSLTIYAAYRFALAVFVVRRLRRRYAGDQAQAG